MKSIAIVLAAGSGKRMQSATKKQFLLVREKPVLYYSLKAFQDSFVDKIIIVASKDDESYIKEEIINRYGFTKVACVVEGGSERYHSVLNGLRQVEKLLEAEALKRAKRRELSTKFSSGQNGFATADANGGGAASNEMIINGFRVQSREVFFDDDESEETTETMKTDAAPAAGSLETSVATSENVSKSPSPVPVVQDNDIQDDVYIFVHDGARPMVNQEILKRAYEAVKEYGACVVGMPSKDTVKIADEQGMVVSTPKRDLVWTIQTPQVFEFKLIKDAYEDVIGREEELKQQGISITDDAMVLELSTKHPVKLVDGSYQNIKVTTPEDLTILENFLKKFGQ